MHEADDRRDGFTLFAGVMMASNRSLDFPSPQVPASELKVAARRNSVDKIPSIDDACLDQIDIFLSLGVETLVALAAPHSGDDDSTIDGGIFSKGRTNSI
jgi:hypothetical protein